MAEQETVQIAKGANQQGVRDHNERLILSMIQRLGPLPGSEIAKQSKLSPQTVSIILRSLESDGFLAKGEPQRGRVGKPSIPMALAPDAAFSVGLKIGRRTADALLTDIHGQICWESRLTYGYPDCDDILAFIKRGLDEIDDYLGPKRQKRLAGIGIAMPSEMWNWYDKIGATQDQLARWQDFDLIDSIKAFCDLPVFIDNDATAACRAELAFGQGRHHQNFAYFFLGSFIGGGVVLNGSVFEGPTKNAGAFGLLPAHMNGAPMRQLIDAASIYLLEDELEDQGVPQTQLWSTPLDWSSFPAPVNQWVEQTAQHLACSALTVCAVIDFESVIIDGALPDEVRKQLIAQTNDACIALDSRGLIRPKILEGSVGPNARALGASSLPVTEKYFL